MGGDSSMTLQQLADLNAKLKNTSYRAEMHPYDGKLAIYKGANKKPVIAAGYWAVNRRADQLLRGAR